MIHKIEKLILDKPLYRDSQRLELAKINGGTYLRCLPQFQNYNDTPNLWQPVKLKENKRSYSFTYLSDKEENNLQSICHGCGNDEFKIYLKLYTSKIVCRNCGAETEIDNWGED